MSLIPSAWAKQIKSSPTLEIKTVADKLRQQGKQTYDYQQIRQQIILNQWPAVVRTQDGKWQRDWRISVRGKVPVSTALKALSSEISADTLQVLLNRKSDYEIVATVLMEEDGWSDEFFFESYRLFEKINAKVGEIETIEGEPRDQWPPWRWHKLKH